MERTQEMKILFVLAVMLAGCSLIQPKSQRVDFSCFSYAKPNGTIQTDCADPETWKAFVEKQMRERGI